MLDLKTNKLGKILYPSEFFSKYVFCHSSINTDLEEIINRSGEISQFARKFRRALNFLEQLKRNCIQQKTFERLSDEKYLYSMRIKNGHNIRILFSFFKCDNEEIVILLYCFSEKSSSTNKKNPKCYSHAIKAANKRIEDIKHTYPGLEILY